MENFARVVFTIIFITILAGVIVAFGLFAVAPAEKVVKVFTGTATSTEQGEETRLSEALSQVISEIVSKSLPTSTVERRPPSGDGVSGGGVSYTPPPVPGTPENPQQSAPVVESQVPAGTIALTVSPEGFTPARFTVAAGEIVTLALTSVEQTHVFYFEDEALKNVAIGVGPDETRLIEFYAPDVSGEYVFYCDVPGHRARGEEGVMVVE